METPVKIIAALLAAALAVPAPAILDLADAEACGGYTPDPNRTIIQSAWRFIEAAKLPEGMVLSVVSADWDNGTAAVDIQWSRTDGETRVTYARTLHLRLRTDRNKSTWTVRELGIARVVGRRAVIA
jgi:hypothetical protein